jgi:outer membrane protein TolC
MRMIDGVPNVGPALLARPRRFVFVVALLFLPALAFAQAPVRVVEFEEAIKEALAKNPTVAQAVVAITRADALVMQARSYTVPSVQASFSNTTLDGERGFNGGVTQPQNQSVIAGNVTYRVGGWLAVDQARDNRDVATSSSVEVRQGVAVAAAQAYLAIIAAKRNIEVFERARATARAHFDYSDRRFEGGVGSRLNRLRAEQAVINADLQLEAGQLALHRAQEALGVIMVADGRVDAGAEPALTTPSSVDETVWIGTRPDLLTQAAIRRGAERIVKDYWKREWAPYPVLSFDPQIVTPSGLFQPSKTWRFSVSMVQPIFDGGQRRATKSINIAAVESAKLAFSDIQIRARSEVRVAQEAAASLSRSLAAARRGVEHANEVLRITTTAFEVGATTNIEVIDAQRVLRDAETQVAALEDQARRARLDLLVAIGRFPQ